jgi:CubicO group peptidase (beta-lactamase class C family)
VPVDENSLWRIYSMTKPVTGLAALLLVEDARLELDQPVADVLPEFRSMRVILGAQSLESRPAANVITMRHLLTHTSGLDYWIHEASPRALTRAHRERGITPADFGFGLGESHSGYGPQARGLSEMVKRLAELPLAHEPGTGWLYSVGLDVMGAVIERITGKGLDAFFRERIFEPLDMRSTGFQVARSDVARLTTLYQVTSNPPTATSLDAAATSAWLEPPAMLSGGAGLISSARDYARFGDMLLGDGALGGVRVAKAATVRLALSNLLPASVQYSGGGFGAGAESNPGAFGWTGAAGTAWWIDPKRRAQAVFMSQHLPWGIYRVWEETREAFAQDSDSRVAALRAA